MLAEINCLRQCHTIGRCDWQVEPDLLMLGVRLLLGAGLVEGADPQHGAAGAGAASLQGSGGLSTQHGGCLQLG